VPTEQINSLLRTKTGILAGIKTVKKNGWKIGDKVTLTSNTPQRNGSRKWTFDMLGAFENSQIPGSATVIISNYKYLDDSRVTDKGTADAFYVRVKDPSRAAAIGAAIDKLFASSSAPTRTTLEKAGAQSGLQSLGDVRVLTHAVGAAVLFMLLFLTGNTMMESVRERIPEFGVLKTLGFSDLGVLGLVLSESLLLCAVASGIGLAIIKLCLPPLKQAAPPGVGYLLQLPWSALAMGFLCGLTVAFASAVLPALHVKRVKVVDALANR
jgi:putative ABC transport system permease protein